MIRYIILMTLCLIAMSCEKRDVLAEQGTKTGKDYPYITLSSIPDSRPADTVYISTRFWAINDDIERLDVFQDGFKVRDLDLQWEWTVNLDSTVETRTLAYTVSSDSVFYPETPLFEIQNTGVALDTFYRTSDNAYVFIKPWVIPDNYAIADLDGEEVVDSLSSEDMTSAVDYLISQVDRSDVLQWLPNADSSYFVLDNSGEFTGEISVEGKTKLKTDLDKTALKAFLTSASYVEESEIKLRAAVENQAAIVVEDESTFDILN